MDVEKIEYSVSLRLAFIHDQTFVTVHVKVMFDV